MKKNRVRKSRDTAPLKCIRADADASMHKNDCIAGGGVDAPLVWYETATAATGLLMVYNSYLIHNFPSPSVYSFSLFLSFRNSKEKLPIH